MANKAKKVIDYQINYQVLTSQYFAEVIQLANKVHGDGYLNNETLISWVNTGITDNINTSFVALHNRKVVGFRITFSADNWHIDQWCSPEKWQVPKQQCCYFKCNTVDDDFRGLGIGKKLLNLAITSAQQQGAVAGVSHLWKQSPNNSAVAYFTHCGGEHVASHPDKWHEDSKQGYDCVLCGYNCHCEAAEMIIYFD
ncbi:GNAT family N-acetyltransferase [Colwellia sp. D2M02]|uniref:GNAT family N-acetyltransferase n=1 Tax=Colwellia sp. D2M02 TaxID=2841562 RepID=UPI001C0A201F|nr:GNAT family N-acetyltransferase [Colwellia sp. D2M02]MBU2893097.1 GNAT family N-acetyltransferase [Colwellia sp. D2M02]